MLLALVQDYPQLLHPEHLMIRPLARINPAWEGILLNS
jgi:hypothetical protein